MLNTVAGFQSIVEAVSYANIGAKLENAAEILFADVTADEDVCMNAKIGRYADFLLVEYECSADRSYKPVPDRLSRPERGFNVRRPPSV